MNASVAEDAAGFRPAVTRAADPPRAARDLIDRLAQFTAAS
jgi:hypothetical protein